MWGVAFVNFDQVRVSDGQAGGLNALNHLFVEISFGVPFEGIFEFLDELLESKRKSLLGEFVPVGVVRVYPVPDQWFGHESDF